MSYSPSGRFSSEYHTASSFDPQNEALNSTVAFNDNTEGSADMSIEVGRGAKRTAREEALSEDGIFTFGSDQQYEMTGTPPLKTRDANVRKSDGTLRRDATVRKASEVAKANDSVRRTTSLGGKRQTSLADALKTNADHTIDDTMQGTVTVPSRNTRFTRFQNPATNNGARILSGSTLEGSNPEPKDPSRFRSVQKNTTVHSTGSFLIPDIDGMTQLIGGTPAMPRSAKKSSRFTPSATYRMPSRSTGPSHLSLDGVPVPDDAKQVYAGLQQALDRIAQLEIERADSLQAADDYEALITELRAQLDVEQRMQRPDSGLGSEEEGSKDKWRRERAQLQNQVKSLQDRLTKSERQTNIHEAAVRRVTQERAEIVSQVEDAIYNLEEVKAENEVFRENFTILREENEDLKEEVAMLREENDGLRALMAKANKSNRPQQLPVKEMEEFTLQMQEKKQRKKKRSSRHEEQTQQSQAEMVEQPDATKTGHLAFSQLDEKARDSIANLVQRELQRIQETAKARAQATILERNSTDLPRKNRSRSRVGSRSTSGHERRASTTRSGRRTVSAPVESSESEAESEFEAELTARTRGTLRDMTLPSTTQAKAQQDDTADLTNLSKGSVSTSEFRRVLEEERRSSRPKRHSSAPLQAERDQTLTKNVTKPAVLRKSSMKDITSGLQLDATGKFSVRGESDAQKASRTVRVQSPHLSDLVVNRTQQVANAEEADTSTLTSVSQRRRRAAAAAVEDDEEEGETSAFIIPDITIHTAAPTASATKTFAIPDHKMGECTICAQANGKHLDIPLPIPVSTRDLGEDATLRPAWAPHLSLAHVLKQLEDEVAHLKLQLAKKQAEYSAHDPALGRRRRVSVHAEIEKITAEVERRSDMVYRLYDVVEGQKEDFATNERKGSASVKQDSQTEQEIEETLQSIGMDPSEAAGRVGRGAPDVPEGLQEEYSGDETDELPWEGVSDTE
jgi:hypothetical protein